jgi:hypothetical protein
LSIPVTCWFALLLCLGIAADVVFDLVFEQPELVAVAGPVEEPDNPAEHLLVPSPRAGHDVDHGRSVAPADFRVASIRILAISDAALLGSFDPPPPRSHPVSFNAPLRI